MKIIQRNAIPTSLEKLFNKEQPLKMSRYISHIIFLFSFIFFENDATRIQSYKCVVCIIHRVFVSKQFIDQSVNASCCFDVDIVLWSRYWGFYFVRFFSNHLGVLPTVSSTGIRGIQCFLLQVVICNQAGKTVNKGWPTCLIIHV